MRVSSSQQQPRGGLLRRGDHAPSPSRQSWPGECQYIRHLHISYFLGVVYSNELYCQYKAGIKAGKQAEDILSYPTVESKIQAVSATEVVSVTDASTPAVVKKPNNSDASGAAKNIAPIDVESDAGTGSADAQRAVDIAHWNRVADDTWRRLARFIPKPKAMDTLKSEICQFDSDHGPSGGISIIFHDLSLIHI